MKFGAVASGQGFLFEIRQDHGEAAAGAVKTRVGRATAGPPVIGLRQRAERVVKVVDRQANLLEVVLSAHPVGRAASTLHSRQEQRDKHTDDRDDDEQFDERKGDRRRDPPAGPTRSADSVVQHGEISSKRDWCGEAAV
jgi:hypothetical protein